MDYNLQVLLAKIIFVHLKEVKYCVDLGFIYIYIYIYIYVFSLDTMDSEGVGMGCMLPSTSLKGMCSVNTSAPLITRGTRFNSIAFIKEKSLSQRHNRMHQLRKDGRLNCPRIGQRFGRFFSI